MKSSNLTLVTLALLFGVSQTAVGQKPMKNCCEPTPVGGLKTLEQNVSYPLFDLQVRNNADVILNFYVDATGNVSNIQVAKSGGSQFDKSAMTAVMNTKWIPAMQNGFPVGLSFALPFEFRAK